MIISSWTIASPVFFSARRGELLSHFQQPNLVTAPFLGQVHLPGLCWSPASKGHGNSIKQMISWAIAKPENMMNDWIATCYLLLFHDPGLRVDNCRLIPILVDDQNYRFRSWASQWGGMGSEKPVNMHSKNMTHAIFNNYLLRWCWASRTGSGTSIALMAKETHVISSKLLLTWYNRTISDIHTSSRFWSYIIHLCNFSGLDPGHMATAEVLPHETIGNNTTI